MKLADGLTVIRRGIRQIAIQQHLEVEAEAKQQDRCLASLYPATPAYILQPRCVLRLQGRQVMILLYCHP